MNIEDLRKLREQLETARKGEKKYGIFWPDTFPISVNYPLKTLDEFLEDDRTEKLVQYCEKLFEYTTRILTVHSIPCDNITISGAMSLLIDNDIVQEIEEFNKLNREGLIKDEDKWYTDFYNKLGHHVAKDYVYISFLSLDDLKTGYYNKTGELIDLNEIWCRKYGCGPESSWEFEKYCSDSSGENGVVNLTEFLFRLSSLGYEVNWSISNSKSINVENYVDATKNDEDYYAFLSITADFARVQDVDKNKISR